MSDIEKPIGPIMRKKPILVTGGNRTGTTWVGRMLAASPRLGYIREAFNIEVGLLKETDTLNYEYQHIPPEDNNEKYIADFERVLNFKYTVKQVLGLGVTCPQPFIPKLKPRIMHYLSMKRYRFEDRRPLLKDPVALFSAEWLSNIFNMPVVVLIRHPAAYVASIKRLCWRFDFRNLTEQKKLMEHYLSDLKDDLYNPPDNLIAKAALLWKCFYLVVEKYRHLRPDWIFVRHEDLIMDPVNRFKNLYQHLDIPFGPKEEQKISDYTSGANPVDAPGGAVHYLKRDSKSLLKNWRNKLDSSELQLIKRIVRDVSDSFYTAQEW